MSGYQSAASCATRALILTVMTIATAAAQATPHTSEAALIDDTHFVSGESFRELSEAQQEIYVAGLSDGFMMAPAFGGGTEALEETQRFKSCVKGKSTTQLAAI